MGQGMSLTTRGDSTPPLKFILLAPTSMVGGIATWTRYFLDRYNRERIDPIVIDNAKKYEEIGKESNLRGTLLGVLKSFQLLFHVILALRARPKLIYLTCSGYWSFFTRDLMLVTVSRWLGLKTLIHLRGGRITSFCGHSPLSRLLARQVLKRAQKIIVVSREVGNYLRPLYPQTVYLPNMLDEGVLEKVASPKLRSRQGEIKALHMAWQSPAKGSYDILEACALLKERLPGLTCDLVGRATPEHEAVILGKIKDLGLEGRVRLQKETAGDKKWKYFNEADLFLFPSHTEGFPNVILEAMCFGLPIIASDVGNIREMVGGDSGDSSALILEKNNPISAEELADFILHLASDRSLMERLAANGRERVKSYLVGSIIPQIEEFIIRTAENK